MPSSVMQASAPAPAAVAPKSNVDNSPKGISSNNQRVAPLNRADIVNSTARSNNHQTHFPPGMFCLMIWDLFCLKY